MLIPRTIHLLTPRVLESVYREQCRGSSAGFMRINRYIICDVITRIFTVQYDIYNSWCPEFTRSGTHSPLTHIITEIDLSVYLHS
jgi:hypothetical protein